MKSFECPVILWVSYTCDHPSGLFLHLFRARESVWPELYRRDCVWVWHKGLCLPSLTMQIMTVFFFLHWCHTVVLWRSCILGSPSSALSKWWAPRLNTNLLSLYKCLCAFGLLGFTKSLQQNQVCLCFPKAFCPLEFGEGTSAGHSSPYCGGPFSPGWVLWHCFLDPEVPGQLK